MKRVIICGRILKSFTLIRSFYIYLDIFLWKIRCCIWIKLSGGFAFIKCPQNWLILKKPITQKKHNQKLNIKRESCNYAPKINKTIAPQSDFVKIHKNFFKNTVTIFSQTSNILMRNKCSVAIKSHR